MADFEWVELAPDDPSLRPIFGPPCGAFKDHTWRLSVEEGRVCLTSGCVECDDVVWGPVGGEDLVMPTVIVGRVESHLETYRGWDYTEYDHWWEFVPERIE